MSTNSNNAGGATRIGSKFRSSTEATEHFKRHERVKNYDIQTTRVQSVSWNCDGSRIAAGSADRTVCVGSVDAACRVKCNFVGAGHTEAVEMVSFHHTNPNMLASASSDKTIRVWDARNPKTHTKLNTKAPNLNVTWSPDGNHILFGDKEDTLVIVDGRNLTRVDSMVFKDELNEMAFDKTGEFLFVTMGSGKIGVYKFNKTKPCLEEVRMLQAHSAQASCQSIAMSPDGERMAIGATDAILSLWNIDDLICERAISRLDYPPRSISFSHDSRLLALGSEDHVIDIAYTDDGSRIHELHVDAETYSVAWHPRYHILAYSSIANERDRDTTIHLFGFLQ